MNNMKLRPDTANAGEDHPTQTGLSGEQTGEAPSMPSMPSMPATPLGAGAQMAAQREANGWTVEQVANQLNLAPRQILALEADDFAALPGTAITRGFIRSYARLLKLDSQALLELTGTTSTASRVEPISARRTISTPFFDDNRMSSSGSQGAKRFFKLLVPVSLVLLLALGGAYLIGWLPQLANLLGVPVSDSAVTAPSVRTGAAVPAQAQSKPAAEADSGTVVTPLAPIAVQQPGLKPAAVQNAAEVAQAAPSSAGKGALVLRFRQDSWFEVRRGSGNEAADVITARTARAGTTETFDLTGPHTLTIGNATGVDASLRGEALDLSSAARNNVVRLNLN